MIHAIFWPSLVLLVLALMLKCLHRIAWALDQGFEQ